MKPKSLAAVLSVLLISVQGAVSANSDLPYPVDAEARYSLMARDAYADQPARTGIRAASEHWGVGKRPAPTAHNPFPFGGGPVDD